MKKKFKIFDKKTGFYCLLSRATKRAFINFNSNTHSCSNTPKRRLRVRNSTTRVVCPSNNKTEEKRPRAKAKSFRAVAAKSEAVEETLTLKPIKKIDVRSPSRVEVLIEQNPTLSRFGGRDDESRKLIDSTISDSGGCVKSPRLEFHGRSSE